MAMFTPERESVRIRHGEVTARSTSAGTVDAVVDGATIAGLPVYGFLPNVGDLVLVLEQGGGLLVLGNPAALLAELQGRVAALERKEARDG